jgi:hypothetical protein
MTGLEALLPLAANSLTGVVLEVLKDKGKEEGGNVLSRWLQRDIGQDVQQLVFQAARQYVENYTKRHGTLKVLGMREPVELDKVFTTVQFLSDEELNKFVTLKDLESTFRAIGRGFRSWEGEKQDGISVARKKQFLMVLGQPGAGKSTFLRKIGLEALKGNQGELRHRNIPVFLELKKFTKSDFDLEALITKEFETCGFPKPKEFCQSALRQGKLLILLDGLDEVPADNINSVITAIQDFVDRHDKNRYIASCRTAAYRYNFKRFSDVILSDFSDEQIQQFIKNWFHLEEDQEAETAAQCWEMLNQEENEAAKELAQTPLLLTFLCLVYSKSQTFSNNRSGLYNKALRILLEEWAAEKLIMKQQIYEGLSVELEEVLLSEVAYAGFEADQLFMPQTQLVERIREFLSSNLQAPKHLDGEAVLNQIAIRQGILVERTDAVYSFSHLTLQEYLTARYICVHDQISQMVEQHLSDDKWREVFLLTSGLMVDKGADALLLAMHNAAKQFARQTKVRALLQWADQMTSGSTGEFKSAAKRAFALAVASNIDIAFSTAICNTIAITIDNTIPIASSNINTIIRGIDSTIALTYGTHININIAIDNVIYAYSDLEHPTIFRELDLSNVVTKLRALKAALESENRTQICKTAEETVDAHVGAFHLNSELISWETEEEYKTFRKYLNSIYLLLKCKQEAARLSPITWNKIESELFLPPINEASTS